MFTVIQVVDPKAFEQCQHAEAKIYPVPKVNPQELTYIEIDRQIEGITCCVSHTHTSIFLFIYLNLSIYLYASPHFGVLSPAMVISSRIVKSIVDPKPMRSPDTETSSLDR